jgi:hypothetical protein
MQKGMRFAIAVVAAGVLAGTVQASAAVWPDACGKDQVQFKVKTQKKAQPPAAPAAGTAQVIFFESQQGEFLTSPTVRYGIDGSWVGANRGVSYFAVSVPAGTHHLCAIRQSATKGDKDSAGLVTLNAEAGKTYYYDLTVVRTEVGTPEVIASGGKPGELPTSMVKDKPTIDSVSFATVTESDAKSRMAKTPLSTFTQK